MRPIQGCFITGHSYIVHIVYNVPLQMKIIDGPPCLLEGGNGVLRQSLAGVNVFKNPCRPANFGGKLYYI